MCGANARTVQIVRFVRGQVTPTLFAALMTVSWRRVGMPLARCELRCAVAPDCRRRWLIAVIVALPPIMLLREHQMQLLGESLNYC